MDNYLLKMKPFRPHYVPGQTGKPLFYRVFNNGYCNGNNHPRRSCETLASGPMEDVCLANMLIYHMKRVRATGDRTLLIGPRWDVAPTGWTQAWPTHYWTTLATCDDMTKNDKGFENTWIKNDLKLWTYRRSSRWHISYHLFNPQDRREGCWGARNDVE